MSYISLSFDTVKLSTSDKIKLYQYNIKYTFAEMSILNHLSSKKGKYLMGLVSQMWVFSI